MEDRFAFLDAYCHYSSSQEELFKTSLLAREEISPESSPPSPSSSAAAFEGYGIIICSAPETPASETAVSPSGDEFKTPPEESRRSSSEEAPPPPKTLSPPRMVSPSHGEELDGAELDGAQGISASGGTLGLGFSQGNRTPKMVEILSDGRVLVGEVSKLDLESFRVGEKRKRPVEEPSPSPSKRIRVSDDCPVLVNTPNVKCPIENGVSDDCPVLVNTPNLKCPIENGVNVDTAVDTQVNDVEVDTQVNDVDSGNGEADQIVDTDVIESYEDGKEDCVNGGISNVEQEHKEEEEEEKEEERMENGNGGKETVVDGAEDLSKQGRRNRTPKMVEILSDGRVRVGEVSKLDLESFRVEEKRERPVEEPSPSPSKRIRVSDDCPVLVDTPNVKCPIENGVNVDTAVDKQVDDVEVDTQVNDVDSRNGEADQIIDTDVIESYEDGKEDCANNGGISNVEQVHEEEDREEEEGMENGNGGKETVVDGAEDLSKQGRQCLPQSWGCRNGGNREAENRPKTERGSSGNGMGVVLEVLRWLAREEREKRRDQGGPVDFLETAKRRGVKFPDSKLWHGQ